MTFTVRAAAAALLCSIAFAPAWAADPIKIWLSGP